MKFSDGGLQLKSPMPFRGYPVRILYLAAIFFFLGSTIISAQIAAPTVIMPEVKGADTKKLELKDPGIGDLLGGKKAAKPAPTIPLAEQFKALLMEVPPLGIIPFYGTSMVEKDFFQLAQQEMIRQVIVNKLYRPYAVSNWLKLAFSTQKANSIRELAKASKDQFVPLAYLMTGYIFRSGTVYGFRVAVYPNDASQTPIYFIRFFNSKSEIPGVCAQIASEMLNRPQKPDKPIIPIKKILINPAKLSFFNYTELKSGEFNFSFIPFLTRDSVDYRLTDDYFTQLLAYNLYTSRMVDVTSFDAPAWVEHDQPNKRYADYVINTQINITSKLAVANFTVKELSSNTDLFTFKIPLRELTMNYLFQTMRNVSKLILVAISTDHEQANMGLASYQFETGGNPDLFCEGYYIGKSTEDLLVPAGLNLINFGPITVYDAWKTPSLNYPPSVGLVIYPFSNPHKLVELEPRFFKALTEGVKQ